MDRPNVGTQNLSVLFRRAHEHIPEHIATVASHNATAAPNAIQTALPQFKIKLPSKSWFTLCRAMATTITSTRNTMVVKMAASMPTPRAINDNHLEELLNPRRMKDKEITKRRKASPAAIG